MRTGKTGFVDKELVTSICSVALFSLALAVSSFHAHQDGLARDDCAICRFQQTRSASPIDEAVSVPLPEFPVLPLIILPQNAPRDVFRFHPVYLHAPPSTPTS